MSQSPKVSVVIPCFNREKYLGMAIQSVLSQSYTDFELIIVDNNSTDGSLEIARIAAQQDNRVRVLTEKSQGASYALRTGFGEARGKYIAQLDSDDLLKSNALEKTVPVLDEDPACGLVYSNYLDIDENGKQLRPGWRCSYPYSKEKILTVFMTFHFRLMRKTAYEKVGGFDTKFDRIEDYDLCLKLSENFPIRKVEEFLYQKRNHSDSILNLYRLEVILLAKQAIESALKRRNMDKTHKLELRFNPHYYIEEINPRPKEIKPPKEEPQPIVKKFIPLRVETPEPIREIPQLPKEETKPVKPQPPKEESKPTKPSKT